MRASIALLFLIGMGGCSVATSTPGMMPHIMVMDGMTVVTTGKTISDHIVSFASNKNCSTVRRQTGQNFCEEDDVSAPEELYCYNSLGNVNCFASPQPYGQSPTTVGHISGKSASTR